MDELTLKASGGRTWDNGTSGLQWALFEAKTDNNGLIREIIRDDFPTVLASPGTFYAYAPLIKRVGNRVLVTQDWGYDI